MVSGNPTIRTSKQSWPFPDGERLRLELVYGLKVSKGGRGPTTKAIFRNMSTSNKDISLLEMDWISLPRLTPGRVFEESPHLSNGILDSDHIWIDIPSDQKIEVLTLRDAQARLGNQTLLIAFNKDPSLPETKVFHWTDSKGHEYWLPAIELMRKMFVRSPEMARSIIMYQGLDELVLESFIQDDTLYITFTKLPRTGDIPLLSLITSTPSLSEGWQSVAKHLPKASDWVAVDLPWLFNEGVSILATSKNIGSTHWIQEILDVHGLPILFKRIEPTHPNYTSLIVDETKHPKRVAKNTPEDVDEPTPEAPESTDDVILEPSSSHISRPKKYIHIQCNSFSELNMIEINPEYKEKKEAPTQVETATVQPHSQSEASSTKKMQGHLSDNVSSSRSPENSEDVGVGTKETQDTEHQWNGLEKFSISLVTAVKELGKKEKTSLSWVVSGTALEKPKGIGSRWFLKMNNGKPRAWCLAKVNFGGGDCYLLEIGRDYSNNKLSLSTLFIHSHDPISDAPDWINKMVINNGHWKKDSMPNGITFLSHLPKKQDTPSNWAKYIEQKVRSTVLTENDE